MLTALSRFGIRTSSMVYIHTDMNSDINTNVNITSEYTSPIQRELPTLKITIDVEVHIFGLVEVLLSIFLLIQILMLASVKKNCNQQDAH